MNATNMRELLGGLAASVPDNKEDLDCFNRTNDKSDQAVRRASFRQHRELQEVTFRASLFTTIKWIIVGYAVAATIFTATAFYTLDPTNIRYITIAYMSTMIIEIIGVMQIVARSIFPATKRKRKR